MRKLLLLFSTITFAFQLYAQVNINIEDVVGTGLNIGDPVSVWISVSDLTGQGIISFQFTIIYDTALVNATGINTLGDIDFSGWTVMPNINAPGEIRGAGFGATVLTGSGNFIELLFEVVDPEGYTDLIATEFLFNAGTPIALVNNGSITLEANQPPGLDPIGDQSMNEGDTLDVPVNATDPDGDNITLTLENAPTFAAFVDNSNGTGTITFTPAAGDSGSYPNIRVIATDDGTPNLTDTIFFTLSVGTEIITEQSDIIQIEMDFTPREYVLYQNYSNPFNPNTTIRFSIPKEVQVNLSVYNILGERVKEMKNEMMKPGYYDVEFDASDLASGVYIYKIKAGDFIESKKMIFLK